VSGKNCNVCGRGGRRSNAVFVGVFYGRATTRSRRERRQISTLLVFSSDLKSISWSDSIDRQRMRYAPAATRRRRNHHLRRYYLEHKPRQRTFAVWTLDRYAPDRRSYWLVHACMHVCMYFRLISNWQNAANKIHKTDKTTQNLTKDCSTVQHACHELAVSVSILRNCWYVKHDLSCPGAWAPNNPRKKHFYTVCMFGAYLPLLFPVSILSLDTSWPIKMWASICDCNSGES